MLSCPTDATLARLGLDTRPGSTVDDLEKHVDECPSCQDRLELLVVSDVGRALVSDWLVPGGDASPRIAGFVIERELGRGATSVVYQARQPSLGRRVALKVLRGGPASGQREHARWLREAKSWSRVRHENVVRLYQVGESNGWLYMVLELVPGGNLQEALAVPYAPRDGARLVATIATAVAAIHHNGRLHLDLKPSNILLDRSPEAPRERATPRVGDFGIAAPWNDPDATAMPTAFGPVGTPSYMAPEQVAGDRARIGPAADVYGLGAVFYHVLTGHPPFTTSSVAEMFEQVQSHEPVPPRRLDPAVPRDLETICQKCLRKDERRRYASAQALADDLRRWLDGRPIAARPVSPLERTWVSCRRRPAIAALAFSLALALCAGFVGMLVLWNQAEAQRLRAELDSKVLGDVLSLIVGINAEGNYFPRVADHDRLIANLQMTRKSLLEVAPRRSAQALIDRHLALVDMRLGNALVFEGRWEEARGSLAESVLAWERVVHAHPLDLEARANLAMTLRSAAQVAERQERDNDSEAMLRHALAVAAELMNLTVDAGSICVLADSRYNLAQFLARRGNGDAASALHAANRRMLLESTVESENPDVMAWRVFLIDGFDRVTSVSSPASTGIAPVDGRGSLASPGALELDRLSAERWAETVSEHLHSAARAGSPPSLLADAGFRLTSHFCAIAAEQRHAQKLDGARRTTERIVAFANGLVGRYPDQAFAHLALGEAFAQLQKNASQIGDRPVVERNLKLALDAALDALALDPKNEMARFIADKRRRRLRDLMAGR